MFLKILTCKNNFQNHFKTFFSSIILNKEFQIHLKPYFDRYFDWYLNFCHTVQLITELIWSVIDSEMEIFFLKNFSSKI